jgi:hypothetical protein
LSPPWRWGDSKYKCQPKSTKINQYFKEKRALRTETTISNSRDLDIGRRLHGSIERIPHTRRYEVNAPGKRVCLFFIEVNARIIHPGLSQLLDGCPKAPSRPLAVVIKQLISPARSPLRRTNLPHENLTHLHRACGLKEARPTWLLSDGQRRNEAWNRRDEPMGGDFETADAYSR